MIPFGDYDYRFGMTGEQLVLFLTKNINGGLAINDLIPYKITFAHKALAQGRSKTVFSQGCLR